MKSISLKHIAIVAGPLLGLWIWVFTDLDPANPVVTRMAAIAVWMAVWWLTEAVNMAITSVIPVLFLPLLGIADIKLVMMQYVDKVIFLFAGGFIIAIAIERWNLHKRIALRILMAVGSRPSDILLGVMLTSFLISMWISNTATTLMLLSAVMAVIHQMETHLNNSRQVKAFSSALLVGLAYAATIGGMATLVGTPTNMIFFGKYIQEFPRNNDMNFSTWFIIGFPLALLFLGLSFLILRYMFIGHNKKGVAKNYFKEEYRKLGLMSYEEKVVGTVFIVTALLWFTRADLVFDSFTIKGWAHLFPKSEWVNDSIVAVVMAIILFLVPSGQKRKQIISFSDLQGFPYDILLLFGGGFALAKGFETSGLSNWMAAQMNFTNSQNIYGIIFITCVLVCAISEFASNVACIQLMIPILISIQDKMGLHPLTLLVPATLAASLGFMLPVATAPNTIVFGTKRVRSRDMLKAGLLLDIAGIVLITLMMWVRGNF